MRVAALLIVLGAAAGVTLLLDAANDPALVLRWITGAMLVGSLLLLGFMAFADLRDVAASWRPGIAVVMISSLVIVSTSALAAGLPLGSLAALISAIAVAILTLRASRLPTG
jgi:hypothetical protein